ncbi:nicotinate-nucleotide adenylyltransferase [Shewanella sp. 202IG2-18]|uniref:nicotinate-nucleotide adenylyltransferase n=1 Tax=Parashewanella hymeniacidonis TaxID=2807618 RepID=UPI001962161F|nr:nicotinate-nucleotide adenylyltransferase [Parashewanella hymeniacidonis]MBM7070487.1 nicotinate-nucleotide adenylyltransferase [Parashewanella hymeniacidonis]
MKNSEIKRIGILGGTFDPIHFGHIRPALQVKQALNLDKIWLMPNHIPPHKNREITTIEHRLNMVKLVCDEYADFELCEIEVKRDTPSYTVTTLKALTQSYPNTQFTFLMGMDSLLSLTKWFQWQQLFDLCDIAITHRPGYQVPTTCEIAPIYQKHLSSTSSILEVGIGRIFDIDVELQDISSTHIRKDFNDQRVNDSMIPQSISAYIKENQLYR